MVWYMIDPRCSVLAPDPIPTTGLSMTRQMDPSLSHATLALCAFAHSGGGQATETGQSAHAAAPLARAAQHLVERLGRVETRLTRQAQDAFADAVALHLVRAGGDSDDAAVEVVQRRLLALLVALGPRQRRAPAHFETEAGPDRRVHAGGQLGVGGDGVVGFG